MKKVGEIESFPVYILEKDVAKKYAKRIAQLLDAIPLVDYTEKEILAESKEEREFFGKWEHSFVVFDHNIPIAVIICYERKAEGNVQYPVNSLYISELAVDEVYRGKGIARKFIKFFLNTNKKLTSLDGQIAYSVQTNSADWNSHVVRLYESFGFKKIAFKQYDNRRDAVLFLK
ncbi:MAG: GNAT family N-acetyltransferase [Patescibacteria group bacterium]|jgi:GNAT superfamily N-acetyltransferase